MPLPRAGSSCGGPPPARRPSPRCACCRAGRRAQARAPRPRVPDAAVCMTAPQAGTASPAHQHPQEGTTLARHRTASGVSSGLGASHGHPGARATCTAQAACPMSPACAAERPQGPGRRLKRRRLARARRLGCRWRPPRALAVARPRAESGVPQARARPCSSWAATAATRSCCACQRMRAARRRRSPPSPSGPGPPSSPRSWPASRRRTTSRCSAAPRVRAAPAWQRAHGAGPSWAGLPQCMAAR